MFAPQRAPGRPAGNPDSWDGYRSARDRVFDMVEQLKLDSFIVLTGDVHSSWAYDFPRRPFDAYNSGTGRGSLGVEFAGTSVTSSTASAPVPTARSSSRQSRPPGRICTTSTGDAGYFLVDLTRERLQVDFYAMKTILDRTAEERFVKGFAAAAGQMHLTEQASPVPPAPAPEPAP